MKIAVLSGKGGTGKTTVSTNLSALNKNITLIDSDVEEPNASIFLKPIVTEEEIMFVEYPMVDSEKCTLCGKCGELCKFNAIIPAKNTVLVFKESCHACGSCELVCPTGAIKYEKREIGKVIKGKTILVDGSPGIACNVISSITGSKKIVLVTEPSFSGLHDLKRVYELTQKFRLPVYVVINKYDLSLEISKEIENYCNENSIKLSLKIPFNKDLVKSIVNKKIPSVEEKEFFDSLGFQEFIKELK